jgi:2-hydroxy-6-oxonona-2,4-dienedioate hydrolase
MAGRPLPQFTSGRLAASAVVAVLLVVATLVYRQFDSDVTAARARVSVGSTVVQTRCGPIEYAEVGQGTPLLVVHGAGGGFDQGMQLARPLAERGFRAIAMSRFGYLRTPLPADPSPSAQADAHACLLDELGVRQVAIIGVSAGGPSSMQFAIRHPDRCAALILLVPLAWKPADFADTASKPAPWTEKTLEHIVGSDFVFWSTLHLARNTAVKMVLATPPAVLAAASSTEQARANDILDRILPISARADGLRNDSRIATTLVRYDLESIRAPTLVISLRDDLFNTFAGAHYTAQSIRGAKFIGYDEGGHIWAGHGDAVLQEVASFVAR